MGSFHKQPMRNLARRWTALGAMFNVPSAPGTPDLELLLCDAARLAGTSLPQFQLAVTWLAAYGDLVARHRLARMIRETLTEVDQPAMGLLLESAVSHTPHLASRFHGAIRACRRAAEPMPLLEAERHTPALRRLASASASPLARKWGRWVEPIELKPDALRPAEWIGRHHPQLALRALVAGDLVASILAEAATHPHPFASEVELAHRCGGSRPAVRDALAKLRLAGLVTTVTAGRRNLIHIRLKSS